jgi:hypothetical protein
VIFFIVLDLRLTKAEKEKETKEKAARRDKTAGNTVLALKNNSMTLYFIS